MNRCLAGLVLYSAVALPAFAAGRPDHTFGTGGLVTLHAGYEQPAGIAFARDLIVDSSGRYVAAGSARIGGEVIAYVGFLARLLEDGSLDVTFGGDGIAHYFWQGKPLTFGRVREAGDGRLLVLGHRMTASGLDDVAVVCRILHDGKLDQQFATGGCRDLSVVNGEIGLGEGRTGDLMVQSNGRIVVLGTPASGLEPPRGFALVGLLADGSFDPDFGDSECANPLPKCGVVLSPEQLGDEIRGAKLALDAQTGRMVVGSHMNVDSFQLMTALFYESDGSFDTVVDSMNFDALTGATDTNHYLEDVEVAPDGTVYLVGRLTYGYPTAYAVAAARILPDGKHDPAFGNAGRVIHVFDAQQPRNAPVMSVLQQDGRVLIVGNADGDHFDCHMLRLDGVTGALDPAFGLSGTVSVGDGGALGGAHCHSAAVVADARGVVFFGTRMGDADPVLLRVDRDGLFSDGLEH